VIFEHRFSLFVTASKKIAKDKKNNLEWKKFERLFHANPYI